MKDTERVTLRQLIANNTNKPQKDGFCCIGYGGNDIEDLQLPNNLIWRVSKQSGEFDNNWCGDDRTSLYYIPEVYVPIL